MTAGRVGFFERPVSDDCLLFLDAGDPLSYPGTGTVWTDLSGTNNTGTLVGATFSSNNGGYFSFSGAGDYVYTENSHPATIPYNSNFTVIAWFKTLISSGKKIIGLENVPGLGLNATAMDRNLYVGTNGLLYWGVRTITPVTVASLATVTNDVWRYAVGVYDYDAGQIHLYIDAVLQNTAAIATMANYSYYIKLAAYRFPFNIWPNTVTTGYFPGDIAFGAVYKRAFGLAEIQSTFNATRGRFGV